MSKNQLLIKQAGEAVKAGDKRQARKLLLAALRQDARDYTAWLGLARIAPSPQASLDYARRAARLQPDAPLTKKVLAWAEQRAVNEKQPTENSQQLSPQLSQQLIENNQQSTADKRRFGGGWSTAVTWASIAFIIVIMVGGGLLAWRIWGNGETAVQPMAPSASAVVQVERSLPEQSSAAAPAGKRETAVTPTPSLTPPAIQPKHLIEGKEGAARATWTVTPTPTDTPTPAPTPLPTFVSPDNGQPTGRPFGVGQFEHWIDVNLSAQTLTAYEGNTAVYNTLISSGLASYPTVTGQFRVWLRYESQTMDGARLGYDYYLENVPYVMYFYEDYALHGTFWHNNFGQPMSHGCVNMYTPDAQWLFNWSTIGTVVNVHY